MNIQNIFCSKKMIRLKIFLQIAWFIPYIFLQGCTEVKKTLGIERTVPEEFDVIENAPLIIPPYTNLPAPIKDSSAPLNVVAPEEAEAALLGSPNPVSLKNRGVIKPSESSIKQTIDREASNEIFQDNRPEWIKKIFFWQQKKPGTVLNPEEESIKLKKAPIAEISQNSTDARDTFLLSPETEISALEGNTTAAVNVPEIATVQVLTPGPDEPSVEILGKIQKPSVLSATSVAKVQIKPVARSATELYGGTVKRNPVVPTVRKTYVFRPVLLTKILPSDAVIRKYIDVRKKKPKIKVNKRKVESIVSENVQFSMKDSAEKDLIPPTEQAIAEQNVSEHIQAIEPVVVEEIPVVSETPEAPELPSLTSVKPVEILQNSAPMEQTKDTTIVPTEIKHTVEFPVSSDAPSSTEFSAEESKIQSQENDKEGEIK